MSDTRGIALIFFACLAYLIGVQGAEYFLLRISMILLAGGLIWTFWGQYRLRRLAFVLVLLAATIPLPSLVYNSLSAPLQLFASNVATEVARMAGVAVYRDGNIIRLAGTSLGVEEACSGLNSLASLMVGALLLGRLRCNTLASRAALLLLSAPLAIGINVLRIAGTAILSDANEDYALGFFHMFSGWLVFLIGVAGLLGAASLLQSLLNRESNRTADL
jgi:exosortase